MTPIARQNIVTALAVILLLASALFLARRPYYNWDMFPYMTLVMLEPDMPFDSLHAAVYQAARESMPRSDFEAIGARQPELMKEPRAFREILPYFEVKPGYTLFARSLYSLGINPLTATWMPSVIAYFGLCLSFFLWSNGRSPLAAGALFTAIIASSPPMTDLARYSSPDMLGTFLQVAGAMMILTNRVHAGMALLTIALTVRPDAILLVLPITAALWRADQLPWRQAIGWSLADVSIVFWLFASTHILGEYLLLDLSPSGRLDLYVKGMSILAHSYFIPVAALAAILILVKRKSVTTDLLPLLVLSALLSTVTRFVLHPFYEDRFNLPAYLLILVVGWSMVTAALYPGCARKT